MSLNYNYSISNGLGDREWNGARKGRIMKHMNNVYAGWRIPMANLQLFAEGDGDDAEPETETAMEPEQEATVQMEQ